MKSIVILLLFTISLFGEKNPQLFALLGDKLFNATYTLEKYKHFKQMEHKIAAFQNESKQVRHKGIVLEQQDSISTIQRKQYLTSLRKLNLIFKNIIKDLQEELINSIKTNNYEKFSLISDSGLTDIFENPTIQNQAIKFYLTHKKEHILSSIESLILEQKHKELFQKTAQEPLANKKQKKTVVSRLRIIIKTSKIKDSGSKSMDVRFYINTKDVQEQRIFSLINNKYIEGTKIVFRGIKVNSLPKDVNSISLNVQGHDAWHINYISFQFIHNNEYSKEYIFTEKQCFSSNPSDLNRGTGCLIKKRYHL